MRKTTKYNITAIAKELGVTRQTIYYWIKKSWVIPKKDYRNYPVFSATDLRCIKKWHGTLKKAAMPPKKTTENNPPLKVVPMTWAEIQNMLYKKE
jgi:DNA-binding transcriptional MerR regulator